MSRQELGHAIYGNPQLVSYEYQSFNFSYSQKHPLVQVFIIIGDLGEYQYCDPSTEMTMEIRLIRDISRDARL
jgi:hypothetical protein